MGGAVRGATNALRPDVRYHQTLYPAAHNGLGHSHRGTAHKGPAVDSQHRSRADQSCQADVGTRRSARERPRRLRRQPLQFLAGSTDLDSRLWRALGVRGAWDQDPRRRHSADTARRPGPTHEPRARRGRPHRSAARIGVGTVWQRVRRRDQHLDHTARRGPYK